MAKSTQSTPKTSVGFTDTKRVKELVELMAENDVVELELVEDKAKITLRRANPYAATLVAAAPHAPVHHAPVHAAPHAPAPAAGAPAAPAAPAPAADNLVPIKSPMVGTFYSAANPESDPYVAVGARVTEDAVVCIIEAMKVFNEIKAETTGTIAKVLVQNGQAVEFGQPLFMVKPD